MFKSHLKINISYIEFVFYITTLMKICYSILKNGDDIEISKKYDLERNFLLIIFIRETGTSCHRGLVVKKLITQSTYVRKFSFLYCRSLT